MTTQLMESFNLNSDDVVRLNSSENPAETTPSTCSSYEEAKLWLLEDEYERVEGRVLAEQVA